MKRFRLFSCILLTITAIQTMLFADTQVSGNLEGNWTTEGSPYIATNNIAVSHTCALSIEASVEVIFSGNYRFYIQGQLRAIGSEDDSIYFHQADDDEIRIAVYDMTGREVAVLFNGDQIAGKHQTYWSSQGVASGSYILSLESSSMVKTQKLILIK